MRRRHRNYTAKHIDYLLQVQKNYDVASLNELLNIRDDSDDTELGDIIAGSEPSPEDIMINNSNFETLLKYVNKLSAREAMVLTLRYGLEDDVCRTLDEIGKMYGVTRERIRQIEEQAINKLRIKLKRDNITDPTKL